MNTPSDPAGPAMPPDAPVVAASPTVARAFLDTLWPEVNHDTLPGDARLVLWTPHDRRSRRFPVTATGFDLAAERASRLASAGAEVYLGVALQPSPLYLAKPTARGASDTALAIPGLYVELDYGAPGASRAETGHASAQLPPDLETTLVTLAQRFPLEPTVLVGSGGGVHAYWLFREPWLLPAPEAQRDARVLLGRLQHTIRQHWVERGWGVDPTSDLARVLRVPGTVNHKLATGPGLPGGRLRPVVVLSGSGPRYDPDDFDQVLVDDDFITRLYTNLWGGSAVGAATEQRGGEGAAAQDARFLPANLELIASRCDFMAHVYDDRATLPEPEWKHGLGIIARCHDADRLAREWSKGHPGYDAGETADKLARAGRTAPTGCEFIASPFGLAFPGCASCPFNGKVTTPVQLGRRPEDNKGVPPYDPPPPGVGEVELGVMDGLPPDAEPPPHVTEPGPFPIPTPSRDREVGKGRGRGEGAPGSSSSSSAPRENDDDDDASDGVAGRLRASRMTVSALRERFGGPVEPLAGGYLNLGELTIFAGPPESYKSWLLSDLARAVYTGTPWLGSIPVRRGRVVVFEQERARNLSYQLDLLAQGWDQNLDDLLVYGPCGLDLGHPEWQREVSAVLRSEAPALVILNSFRAVFKGRPADSSDVAHALGWLGHLTEEVRCATALVDGTNKAGAAGKLRGLEAHGDSVQKEYEADRILHVERKRDELGRGVGPARVYLGKMRYHGPSGAPPPLVIDLVPARLGASSSSSSSLSRDDDDDDAPANHGERVDTLPGRAGEGVRLLWLDEAQLDPDAPLPGAPGGPKSGVERAYDCLPEADGGRTVGIDTVASVAGMTPGSAKNALTQLKAARRAENPARGQWRRAGGTGAPASGDADVPHSEPAEDGERAARRWYADD